jgi:hypothetical protein
MPFRQPKLRSILSFGDDPNIPYYGSMRAQKAVFVLTGLLVIAGVLAYVFNSMGDGGGNELTYADQSAYDRARGKSELPVDAPALPSCAKAIALVLEDVATTKEVSFSCSSKQERDAFIAQVKSGFLWNILYFEPDRVKLERVVVEE